MFTRSLKKKNGPTAWKDSPVSGPGHGKEGEKSSSLPPVTWRDNP